MYSVVPYRVLINPAGTPDELSDVGEVLKGLSLLGLFAGAAAAHSDGRFSDAKAEAAGQSIGFEGVHVDEFAALATVAVGRSGQVGSLHRRAKRAIDYGPEDVDRKVLRHLLVARPGYKQGILIAERAGNSGSVSLMHRLLRAVLDDQAAVRGVQMRLRIEPLVDATAFRRAYERLPVKKIALTAVDRTTGQPVRRGPLQAKVSMVVTPPHRQSWTLDQLGGFDATALVSAVGAEARPGADTEDVSAYLTADEWDVAVTLERPAGRQSTVHVNTGSAPRMVFDIEQAGVGRPTDAEFEAACQQVLDTFELGSGRLTLPGVPAEGEGWGEVWQHADV